MKSFFKTFLAVLAAMIVVWILGVIITISVVAGMASIGDSTPTVSDNSVLQITLEETVKEQPNEMPFSFSMSGIKTEKSMALRDVLETIRKAAQDDKIKGISLELDSEIPTGISNVQEIRNELVKFKESGKFITAYGVNFSQKGYYLASVADEIYLNPVGAIDFRGMSASIMFYKDLFDKLDVEMQIIRHGKYKSAVEPYMQSEMSPANREQTEKFVQSTWDEIVKTISESRNITIETLNEIADNMSIRKATDAIDQHFVEGTMYEDEYLSLLKTKTGIDEDKDVKYIKLAKYIKVPDSKTQKPDSDKIAIIYAEGGIEQGKSSDGVIGSESLAKELRKARLDKDIKAIVFRVNSPGGDAIASDIILREVKLATEVKPVIVSMGEYAASGGYYISCGANYIFADPTTITGSIGVFGMIPNAQKLLNNRLGLHISTVQTNKNTAMLPPYEPLTPFQRSMLQDMVEDVYDTFITHVSEGRNLSKAAVDSIGQGRVWLGADAKEIGLIDAFGGLNDALAYAAKQIGVTDYNVIELPAAKSFQEQIFDEFLDMKIAGVKLPPTIAPYMDALTQVLNTEGIQARLPFVVVMD